MRLFAALLPPEYALDEVEAALAPHRDAWDLRWTRRATWHVTLAFYGEVDDRVAERLATRLERVGRRHPPRELYFAGAGAFPRPASAHSLWARLHGDLDRLAASCMAAGRREGVSEQRLTFHPHLTLARPRRAIDLRPLIDALTYEGTPWTAAEIHLMRSHLGDNHRYESLATAPLI